MKIELEKFNFFSILLSAGAILISIIGMIATLALIQQNKRQERKRIAIKEKSYLQKMLFKYKNDLKNKKINTKDIVNLVSFFQETILTADAIKEIKWLKNGKISIVKIKLLGMNSNSHNNLRKILNKHFNFMVNFLNLKIKLKDKPGDKSLLGTIKLSQKTIQEEWKELPRKITKYMKPTKK